MKFSPRTLRFREQKDWRSQVCFVWYACDDVFRDGWFVHSMLFVARFTSFFVVELGMGLVVFCTVVSAREVVPVLSGNSRFLYHFLNALVVVASFNIVFNYVCANAFSRRIGHGPRWGDASGPVRVASPPTAAPHLAREERGDDGAPLLFAPDATSEPTASVVMNADSADEPRASTVHRRCGPAVASCLRACGEQRRATTAELAELDRIATECDRYTPRERRYKVLDEPRRFCHKCNRLKAPREHHCNVCGVCVPKMDHHCPWINSCVDVENLRYFFLFLMWLTIGTLLDSTILGYGLYRQRQYEKQVRRLRAGGTAASVVLPKAPFGARGSRLTSFPVVLTVVITALMFFCLAAFLYATARMVMSNTTIIEDCIVEEKQEVFRSTSFVFRNPYDLGKLRNIIETFRTADDPFVRDVLSFGWSALSHSVEEPETHTRAAPRRGFRLQPPVHSWRGRAARLAQQGLLVAWLLLPPSIRAGDSDGVHFPTFFSEIAAGEEEEEMA